MAGNWCDYTGKFAGFDIFIGYVEYVEPEFRELPSICANGNAKRIPAGEKFLEKIGTLVDAGKIMVRPHRTWCPIWCPEEDEPEMYLSGLDE